MTRGAQREPAPMHRIRMRYLTLALALACAFPALAEITRFVGEVVGIRDGDTLSIMQHGKAVTVCLHGIDTPEKGQAFGTRARQCTADLVFRQTVTVVVQGTDRYGRLVGEVLLPDGRSLNQELVRAGMAWWYRQYAPGDTHSRTSKRKHAPPSGGCGVTRRPSHPGSGGVSSAPGRLYHPSLLLLPLHAPRHHQQGVAASAGPGKRVGIVVLPQGRPVRSPRDARVRDERSLAMMPRCLSALLIPSTWPSCPKL